MFEMLKVFILFLTLSIIFKLADSMALTKANLNDLEQLDKVKINGLSPSNTIEIIDRSDKSTFKVLNRFRRFSNIFFPAFYWKQREERREIRRKLRRKYGYVPYPYNNYY